MKLNITFITFLFFAFIISSCEKDPVIPNEEEVITTLTYTLSPSGGGADVILRFQDLDGDGGNAPVITGGTLEVNKTYTGIIELLNELETPAEDITEEVKEEDLEHQFFFTSTISDLMLSYADQDADGNPTGVETTVTTLNAGSGNLTIILRHEPNKSGFGVSTGDISNAGGETDIEVTFPIDVQ